MSPLQSVMIANFSTIYKLLVDDLHKKSSSIGFQETVFLM